MLKREAVWACPSDRPPRLVSGTSSALSGSRKHTRLLPQPQDLGLALSLAFEALPASPASATPDRLSTPSQLAWSVLPAPAPLHLNVQPPSPAQPVHE